ncbi:MAG: DUF4386 domain-containing protein [Ferruginibacter sp.]
MKTLKQTARLAGWFYLAFLVLGIFSFFYVPSKIYVAGNAAQTSANMLNQELLFRFGIAANLTGQVIFILLVLTLYELFRAVNKTWAVLMLIMALVSVPISFVIILKQVATLLLLSGDRFLKTFEPGQLQSLMLLFYEMYNYEILIVGLFWGLWLFPFGWLVIKSGFIPKLLGVLLIIGCFAYLADSFSALLIPACHKNISNFIALPVSVGEIAMIGWLLMKGVKD